MTLPRSPPRAVRSTVEQTAVIGGVLILGILAIGLVSGTAPQSTPSHSAPVGVSGSTEMGGSGATERAGGPAQETGLPNPGEPLPTHVPALLSPASCGDCAYYMQEGAFINQACFTGVSGSCTDYAGFSSLYEDVQVKTSPYYTGYELNGVSNTGDWYQDVVGYNWCASGFDVMNEVWNNAGESISGPCVSSGLVIHANDEVELGLYVASSGDVCLYANDLTNRQSPYTNCVAQPDPGSNPWDNYFAYGANGGYFTGPMTEIVDPEASSCLSYTSMPTMSYQFVPGAYVIHFTPWSDEWYPPTDADCYDSIGSGDWTMDPGDSAAQYVDASDASTYGPHWEAARNISSLSSSTWWQFTTDAVLPTPAATPTALDVGQSVDVQFYEPALIEHIDTNPIYADWDYTVPSSWTCSASDSDEILTCTGTASVAGTYPIQFVIGETGGYSLSSPILDFSVYADPEIASISATPSSTDLGQTTSLSVSAELGSGGYSYAWNNLPAGCTSSSVASLDCIPTSSGTYEVSVTATDSNGVSVTSGFASFKVDPDPTVSAPTASPGSGGIDAGQSVTFIATASGGAGDFSYAWTGLPTGCSSSNLSALPCVPAVEGTFDLRATVTDAHGFSVKSTILTYTVYADPQISAFIASPASLLTGSATQLTVIVSGGAPALTFSYSGLPAGCASSNSATLSCSPTTAGTYHVVVTVMDANGIETSSNLTLVVNPVFIGLPAVEGYAVVAGIIGALLVAAILAILLVRRRREDNDPSIAQRVQEYAPTVRASPVSDITVPMSEVWSNRMEKPAETTSGASAAGGEEGGEDQGPRPPGYWDSPLVSPPDPTCWNCKFENPPASRYCAKCGLPLEAAPS